MLIYADDARFYDVTAKKMIDDKIYCTYEIEKGQHYQSNVADFYELRNIAARCKLNSVHYDIASISYESFSDFAKYQRVDIVVRVKLEHQN